MAIKVPDAMVYYSERDAQAERLLCWIPPQQYPDIAVDDRALERLRKNYPKGVEVRVQAKELEAEGIKLSVDPEDLTKTYRGLRDKGVLHESGMIIALTLEQNARAVKSGESLDSLISADGQRPEASATRAAGAPLSPVRRMAEPPAMKGDEEPRHVFRRLSVRQRPINE